MAEDALEEVVRHDEPTADDPVASTVVEDLMRNLHTPTKEDSKEKGGGVPSYIVVTHQHSTIRRSGPAHLPPRGQGGVGGDIRGVRHHGRADRPAVRHRVCRDRSSTDFASKRVGGAWRHLFLCKVRRVSRRCVIRLLALGHALGLLPTHRAVLPTLALLRFLRLPTVEDLMTAAPKKVSRRFWLDLLLAALSFLSVLRTRSSLKDFSPTRKATTPSSSGAVHFRSSPSVCTTSGFLNSSRASAKGQSSGTGYFSLSRSFSISSMDPCFLMSCSALTGPMPLMLSQ